MNAVNVITVYPDRSIRENKLFTGESAVKKAEAYFKELVRGYLYDVQDEDMSVFLEDGYFCYNHDTYIMISHPEIES